MYLRKVLKFSLSLVKMLRKLTMYIIFLHVTILLNLANGLINDDKFIKDVMELSAVDRCDFGYVYEYGSALMGNEHAEMLSRRFCCAV